jgi:hypothetical protein
VSQTFGVLRRALLRRPKQSPKALVTQSVEHLQWPRQPIGLLLKTRGVALNVTLSLDIEPSTRIGHHLILTAALCDES